ncbi:uncharacterized protein LOC113532621 isoform X3 [Pangasianodon hypophthalmus]|uniref:uncharacterized protein LOC113532621 isoform X3 n=1 Tax=Pangasianodon hypophthalmus TaxID=310915 RepID=UPI002306FA40|nr:uncharacterized protein LOC113532621 isoform X3 [Pangasianodon hypophthalmus]
MSVKYFVHLLIFFSALVPNGLNCSESCNSITLNIQLGSEVLLPCTLLKSNKTEEARWIQTSSLLSIRPNGNITFDDPRDGRMTVFPLLFGRGNFSILVHQFQASDMGIYCCQLSHECQRVEIKLSQSPEDHKGGLNFPWYYIAAGVGIFILLVIVFSLIYKFRGNCLKRSSDSYYVNSERKEQKEAGHREHVERAKVDECDGEYEEIESDTHEADYENTPEKEHDGQYEDTVSEEQDEDYVNTDRRSSHDQYDNTDREYPAELHVNRDMQGYYDNICVYENDEHYPNQKSKSPRKAEFRKKPHQQPNSARLYYANQSEILKSGCPGKRNKKAESQFKNPLYDQSPAHKK